MRPNAPTTKRDTNVGFHPPAETDAPATRSMFVIIGVLLLVGAIIAVFAYRHYNDPKNIDPVQEQQAPPLSP